jgi:hypothetical protein
MTIQIELSPDEEGWLRERAAQRGQAPERLAQEMLRAQLQPVRREPEKALEPVLDKDGVFHADRWEAALQALMRGAERLPVLSPEAVTREGIYQDHD